MNTTWQESTDFPTYDDWIPRRQKEATRIARDHLVTQSDDYEWGLASHLQGMLIVVAYVVAKLLFGAAAIGVLLLVLPCVLVAPAAIAGLLITIAGYVFMFLEMLS